MTHRTITDNLYEDLKVSSLNNGDNSFEQMRQNFNRPPMPILITASSSWNRKSHDRCTYTSLFLCAKHGTNNKRKETSRLLLRKRTIPNGRPPLDGGISANFCGLRRVATRPSRQLISVFCTRAATFHPLRSSVILTKLSEPRSRPTHSQKVW
jgi:hypothetical protein